MQQVHPVAEGGVTVPELVLLGWLGLWCAAMCHSGADRPMPCSAPCLERGMWNDVGQGTWGTSLPDLRRSAVPAGGGEPSLHGLDCPHHFPPPLTACPPLVHPQALLGCRCWLEWRMTSHLRTSTSSVASELSRAAPATPTLVGAGAGCAACQLAARSVHDCDQALMPAGHGLPGW